MTHTGVPLEPGETGWPLAALLGLGIAFGTFAHVVAKAGLVLVPLTIILISRFWRDGDKA